MNLYTINKADIKKLQQFIEESDNIVFFGGAGVSTESGVPDFRSKDGLYNQHDIRFEQYEPEVPIFGFLYPAFSDRSADKEKIDIFHSNPEQVEEGLMYKLFGGDYESVSLL